MTQAELSGVREQAGTAGRVTGGPTGARFVALLGSAWLLIWLTVAVGFTASAAWTTRESPERSLVPLGIDASWAPVLAVLAVGGLVAGVVFGARLFAVEFPAHRLGVRPKRVGFVRAWGFIRAARTGDAHGVAQHLSSLRAPGEGKKYPTERFASVEEKARAASAHRAFRARHWGGWLGLMLAILALLAAVRWQVLTGEWLVPNGLLVVALPVAAAFFLVELWAMNAWIEWFVDLET